MKQYMIEYIKKSYPAGTRIELISMEDPFAPLPCGARGTVRIVDDIGTVHVDWDNGRRLGLIPGEDSFNIIREKEGDQT